MTERLYLIEPELREALMTHAKPTDAQKKGQSVATRGMNKVSASRAIQVAQSRTEGQRYQRHGRVCIRCGQPRTSSFPVCTDCAGG